LCLARIQPGDVYVDEFVVDSSGEAGAFRSHSVCHEAAGLLRDALLRDRVVAVWEDVEIESDEFLSAVRDGWPTFGDSFGRLLDAAPRHVLAQWWQSQ
jgi:hypothetical protein